MTGSMEGVFPQVNAAAPMLLFSPVLYGFPQEKNNIHVKCMHCVLFTSLAIRDNDVPFNTSMCPSTHHGRWSNALCVITIGGGGGGGGG